MRWLIILVFFAETVFSDILQSGAFKCGVKLKTSDQPVENRLGKSAVSAHEWPWLVNLLHVRTKAFICGGTIVSEHHVLTAAHCVNRRRGHYIEPHELMVRLGKHNLSVSEENSEWFYPLDIFIHPDWEPDKKRFDADIAILLADVAIPFSSTISPVCLWTELEEEEDYVGTVVGWGAAETGAEGKTEEVPHQIQVRRVPSSRCYEDFHYIASIASSRTFCAGAIFDKSGPCTGYSGGGFFIEENGVWFIQGIVSATFLKPKTKLCDISKYSLYTKINEFISWIDIRNKDYRVDFVCAFSSKIGRGGKVISECKTFGLSILQPSAYLAVYGKASTIDVQSMRISREDTVYFPNGIGVIFPNITDLLIEHAKLRFLDKRNFASMHNLKNLTIQYNPISNVPNDAFTSLTNLQELKIASCRLTALHPNLLVNNTELTFLNVSGNQFETLPSDVFRNNLKLETILAANNRIKNCEEKIFANLKNLKHIDLSQNFIQNLSSNVFRDLTSLRSLNLNNNRLKSLSVDIFANNLDLEHFRVQYNQIEDLQPGLFRNNLNLKEIYLSYNTKKEVPRTLLSNLSNLKKIDLTGMTLSQLPYDLFFTLISYEDFVVNFNELTSLHKDLLSRNGKLTKFSASFNQIAGFDPDFFRNNLMLREIDLNNNRMTDIARGLFMNLENVIVIDLSYNYIETIANDAFTALKNLQKLNLRDNSFLELNQDLFVQNVNLKSLLLDSDDNEEAIHEPRSNSRVSLPKLKQQKKPDSFKCGIKLKESGLIVGGTNIHPNEWPWLASILYSANKEFFCGGTIVSEFHVLTAAHCVSQKRAAKVLEPRETLVYLGKHNLSVSEPNSVWFQPHDIRVHPDWDPNDDRYDADLAIFVSDGRISFTSTIAPACLWTELEDDEKYLARVIGWGASRTTNHHTEVPQQVKVKRVPSAKCYEDYYKIAKVASARTFCAGGAIENTGPCTGDSGGGYFVEENGVWYIQGIVSSSMISTVKTCDVSKHALYTKINEFLSWINLKSKAYDVELRGSLIVETVDEKNVSTYHSSGLTVTQPAGNMILNRKKPPRNVRKVEIHDQTVVYLPNGFGKLFPTLMSIEVKQSNLRFIERDNFENMENLEALAIASNPIRNIPSDAFNDLKNLKDLTITGCNLVTLPRNLLVNNTKLRSLNLRMNQIESLPNEIFKNNVELVDIILISNRLKVINDKVFANLVNLETLYFTTNIINHVSPQAFKDLKSLKIVYLQENRLKSLDRDVFASNKEMMKIHLGENDFQEMPQGLLRNNLKLEFFVTAFSKLQKPLPLDFFNNLTRLSKLELTGMNLKVLHPDMFISLSALEWVFVSVNKVEVLPKDLLRNNKNLTLFSSTSNRVKELDSDLFRNNLNLRTISLGNNQLKNINGIVFKNLKNLTTMSLTSNLIESIAVDAFYDLVNLKSLLMRDNSLKSLDKDLLINNVNLESLDMDSNFIEHLPAGLIRNNPKLTSISFNYNRIKTIAMTFDLNRKYKKIDFFGNVCINTNDQVEGIKNELIKEIISKCSKSI